MDGMIELIIGLLPLLLSGAVIGGIASYFTPMAIKRLKSHMYHNKIIYNYNLYCRSPASFAKAHPKLYDFFQKETWKQCPCSNCMWLRKKTGHKEPVSKEQQAV